MAATFAILSFAALALMPLPIFANSANEWHATINNYTLYELFRNMKSSYSKADNFTSVLQYICTENNIEIAQLNVEPLLRMLQSKAKHMLSQAKPKLSAGGKTRDKLFRKWRASSYKLKIKFKSPGALKSKLESELTMQIACRAEAEKELEKFKQRTCNNRSIRGTLGQRAVCKRTLRRHRLKGFKQVSQSLPFFGFDEADQPVKISIETKSSRVINLTLTGNFAVSEVQYDANLGHDKALFLKDKYGISDKTYHELARSLPTLPKLCSIKHHANQLNAAYNIMSLPGDIGVYQSLKERLTTRIIKLLDNNQLSEPVIKVKLSGDGTQIGKRIHVVNIVFSVINEKDCRSVTGNHILAILRVEEKYESLKKALHPLICEVSRIDAININSTSYDIVFFLGGDLKFLNVVTGLDACSATYSCLWCHCSKADRWNHNKHWSMTDPDNGARTLESIAQCAKRKSNKFNCSNPPLFDSIPLTRVIPDSLHMFLRIADQLVGHLIAKLREYDNELVSHQANHRQNIAKFEEFVQSLNIEWRFIVDKSGKMNYRDFTGPEHWRILNSIDLDHFLACAPFKKLASLKELWRTFKSPMIEISNLGNENHVAVSAYEKRARDWLKLFCNIFPSKDVTPYMHILANHVVESVRLHGNISNFNQQGLEKLNDSITGWFFRGTNHKNNHALIQIIKKQNRIEDLEMECKRVMKFSVTCSLCGKQGHNKRTCLQVAKSC